MIIAIDIGNTNIVFGIFKNNKLINVYRLNSIERGHIKIDFLLKYNIQNIIISSVVPNLTDKIQGLCKRKIKIKPLIIKHNNIPNLILDVEKPKQVGTDRICNVIAVSKSYKLPAIVIDMGTATKFDVINSEGHFIGGIIAPGIELSAMNLFSKAALLKKTQFKFPENVIGRNTESNIQSGIMYGAIDSINGMIQRIINETKWKNPSIIVTGGFSELIKSELDKRFIINSNLTLEGLNTIHNLISN